MDLRLQLHHHLAHRKFVLIIEGDDWRQEFNSMEEAMTVAASMAQGSIPIFDLDEAGNVLSESIVPTVGYRHSEGSNQQ